MVLELAVVSDTHIPSRTDSIPSWVEDRMQAADHVVNAGDFDSAGAHDRIVELAGGEELLAAVVGNVDPRSSDLPVIETLAADGVTFVVTPGAGPRHGYRERAVETVRGAGGDDAIGIAGHTHEPLDAAVDGVRLLNPRTPTGAPPGEEPTMHEVTVDGDDVSATLHRPK